MQSLSERFQVGFQPKNEKMEIMALSYPYLCPQPASVRNLIVAGGFSRLFPFSLKRYPTSTDAPQIKKIVDASLVAGNGTAIFVFFDTRPARLLIA